MREGSGVGAEYLSKFMQPKTALARLVEDGKAPIMARYRALQQLAHPSLNMLRRLLVQTRTAKGKPTIPARIRALAALRYADEMKLQSYRREMRKAEKKNQSAATNALGI